MNLSQTLKVRAFGLTKIPLIFASQPKVIELNDDRVKIELPLNYFTKNHVGTMYFGALAIGADLACGLLAIHHFEKSDRKFHFLFKDFQANFLKRCEGDTLFICEDGSACKELMAKAIETEERVSTPLKIKAYVPKKLGNEPAGDYTLTLSIKVK